MKRTRQIGCWVVLFGMVAGVLGCSSGPGRGVVKGRVTLERQPVTGAMILFVCPEAGVEARMPLSSDGHYEMKTHEGAGLPPGTYKVAIMPGRVMEPGEEVPLAGQVRAKKTPESVTSTPIPAKYRRIATSDLSAIVKVGNNPPFDFTLSR